MAKTKGQNYMHGAAILTIGVIIMKILGFFYKIPLGNILGDEGYSMFMGAYSIYYIFFTLATAGLPVALSRLVAEADANGRARQEEKTFHVALVTFSLLGLVFASIMFFFPNWLAAVYLDGGIGQARKLIHDLILGHEREKTAAGRDYKTALQELVQRESGQVLTYRLTGESGPDHAKIFAMEVLLNGQAIGAGTGHSKKEAEQAAAKAALEQV